MRTSNFKSRGPLSPLRDLAIPATACALVLVAGCGGGSGTGTSLGTPVVETPIEVPAEDPVFTAPTVALVEPVVGPPSGGTEMTVRGTGFLEGVDGGVEVRIGDKLAADVVVIDDSTLSCLTPDGDPDAEVDVVVTNSRGTGMLEKGFGYLAMPHVSSDLNGDGVADLIIAAQFDGSNGQFAGSVYVFYGVASPDFLIDTSAAAADVKLMGTEADDRFGSSVTSGDVNGDGQDDLIVGASRVDNLVENEGCAYVFLGPLPDGGVLFAQQADVILTSAATEKDEFFGSSLSVGDIDGDFLGDILVGAPGIDTVIDSETIDNVGAAYLFLGEDLVSGDVSTAAHAWYGVELNDGAGDSVMLADLNGDDISDVVIGASLANPVVPPKKYDAGAVYVFLGGESLAGASTTDAVAMYSGEQPSDEFGTALAFGDVNGDGINDLMVSAPGSQALGSETGRAYVFLGGEMLESTNAADAVAIYSGQQSNADFGRDITSSDLNGDGFADLSIGAPHNSFGANKNGRCYVFLGADQPADGLAHHADVIYTGEMVNGERFAYSLEVIDMNGDNLSDIMSGAVGNDGGGVSSGAVYVFEGSQTPIDTIANDDELTLTGESAESNFGSTISRGQ